MGRKGSAEEGQLRLPPIDFSWLANPLEFILSACHHQHGDGRDFGEHEVQCSWQVRKPRPIEAKSTAHGPVGGMEQQGFSHNPWRHSPEHFPDGFHTFSQSWKQAKFFRVNSLHILGFFFSFDSVPFPEALGVSVVIFHHICLPPPAARL